MGNAYQFEKFGTGNSLLRYGIRIRCSKRLPTVRDAFSEAFGVKNRLFRYRRDIRCQKCPPTGREAFSETFGAKKGLLGARDSFSKARRTADSTDCGQPPAAAAAASVRETAHCSEVSKYKKRMTSKSIKTFWSSPCHSYKKHRCPIRTDMLRRQQADCDDGSCQHLPCNG